MFLPNHRLQRRAQADSCKSLLIIFPGKPEFTVQFALYLHSACASFRAGNQAEIGCLAPRGFTALNIALRVALRSCARGDLISVQNSADRRLMLYGACGIFQDVSACLRVADVVPGHRHGLDLLGELDLEDEVAAVAGGLFAYAEAGL